MPFLVLLLTLLFLAVALFALQNAESVTVRFLHWQVQSSLALVTLGATVTGALMAWLLGLAGHLRRWRRGRATPAAQGGRPEPTWPARSPLPPLP